MTTIYSPTLGQIVLLGELYDAQNRQFLGVQLYTKASIDDVTTVIQNPDTQLDLSMCTTFEEKATVIDIKAELSIEILSGLASVQGSAAYLNDSSSNTTQRSWAMRLNRTIQENRFEVGNSSLVVLSGVLSDYSSATHFVSAVQIGGKAVVKMTEVTSKLTEDEKVQGHLKARLEKLQGCVNLEGAADLSLEAQFSDLDEKFDIIMYGDFKIQKAPINAKEVIEVIPDVLTALNDQGVGLSVTLQPIPDDLKSQTATIYYLSDTIINNLMTAFSKLDDLNNRFTLLSDETERKSALIPDMNKAVLAAYTTFRSLHIDLLQQLKKFLVNFYETGDTSDSSSLISSVQNIINQNRYHKKTDSKIVPPSYPTSLGGLEAAFANFSGLDDALTANGTSLSSIDEIISATTQEPKLTLFLSTSVTPTNVAIMASLVGSAFPVDTSVPCYCLYVPDITYLAALPKSDAIVVEEGSSIGVFLFEVTTWNVTWMAAHLVQALPEALTLFGLYSNDIPDNTRDGYLSLLPKFLIQQSFTIVVKGFFDSGSILSMGYNDTTADPLFEMHVSNSDVYVRVTTKDPNKDITSSGIQITTDNAQIAFVQDRKAAKWTVYGSNWNDDDTTTTVNASLDIPSDFEWFEESDTFVGTASNNLKHFKGRLYSVRVYPGALSQTTIEQLSTIQDLPLVTTS